jgi:curved DNA-binding protein CbpA
MIQDPYYVLGLPHTADLTEIKKSYRALAMRLHPDRAMNRVASDEELKASTAKFADVASAYALLSDRARKRQYDHIYKLGGHSSPEGQRHSPQQSRPPPSSRPPAPSRPPPHSCAPREATTQKGIGYKFINPVDYVLSQGKVKSTTVAGVAIPSRFSLGNVKAFQVSISTGKTEESSSGSIHCRSTTTLFTEGKKLSKVETTHIDRQGRKETVIRGDNYVERRVGTTKPRRRRTLSESVKENDVTRAHMTNPKDDQLPWHKKVANVYNDISSNMQRCTNPAISNPSAYMPNVCGVGRGC